MSDRLTVAIINLVNYRHNIRTILKQLDKGVKLMAIVKANAYGHGLEEIAKASIEAGATYIGVVSLGELKRVRGAGITTPTLILNYIDPISISEAVKLDASLTLMSLNTIVAAQKVAKDQSKIINVHIKIDTGMHRAGSTPEEILELSQKVVSSPNLNLEGVFTHFAESEAIDGLFTKKQLHIFNNCLEILKNHQINPPLIHCANSAATLTFPESHFNMVRPGIISFGLTPFDLTHHKYNFVKKQLKPVLSLKCQIAMLKIIKSGETVGYNRRWKAKRTSKLALLPIGYGDGWRRSPNNAGRVLIGGEYVPIVGSVSMDQIVVDVTGLDDIKIGDEAVLIGTQGKYSITADDVADAYGTINYEVVTMLSERIVRKYIT